MATMLVVTIASTGICGEVGKKTFRELDRIVQSGVKAKVYPGAVLVVGSDKGVLFEKAYGHLTYDTTSPAMKLDTMFDLASVSKVVGTATAAMLLLEDGKLKLDDRVSSHVEAFAVPDKEQITVKDLLTHVSGLPAYAQYTAADKARREGESQADALIRHYASLKLKYDTRTSTTYSCLNMQTMARVNENASHRRQEDLLKERVYSPLGMKDTTYLLTDEQLKRCAPTVLRKDGSVLVGIVHDPLAKYYGSTEHCPGNAGVFSTGPDLARYCQMTLNGGTLDGKQVLKPETISLMTSNQMPPGIAVPRGLGWQIHDESPYTTPLHNTPDKLVLGHTGYTGTLLWVDKKDKLYFVFLTNRVYPDDATRKGKPTISTVRQDIAAEMLKSQPGYGKYLVGKKRKK